MPGHQHGQRREAKKKICWKVQGYLYRLAHNFFFGALTSGSQNIELEVEFEKMEIGDNCKTVRDNQSYLLFSDVVCLVGAYLINQCKEVDDFSRDLKPLDAKCRFHTFFVLMMHDYIGHFLQNCQNWMTIGPEIWQFECGDQFPYNFFFKKRLLSISRRQTLELKVILARIW